MLGKGRIPQRGGSRTPEQLKVELIVTMVNGFQPLTTVTVSMLQRSKIYFWLSSMLSTGSFLKLSVTLMQKFVRNIF